MSRNKKRAISIIGLILLLIASSAVGVTISYLSYAPAPKANVFTFGNANIRIVEDQWDALDRVPYGKVLYPGRTVSKDPAIENTGSNELYVYLEVSIPRREVSVVNNQEEIVKTRVDLFSYSVNGEHWTELEDFAVTTNELSTRLYAYLVPLPPGERTTALFDSITFVNLLEGNLAMGTELDVKVRGFAIQTGSLNEQGADAKEKLLDAYTKYLEQKTADDR